MTVRCFGLFTDSIPHDSALPSGPLALTPIPFTIFRTRSNMRQMKLWVGITDNDWFHFLASKQPIEEINFWRPSPKPYRKDFYPGMPFLFKLHAPDNFIVGGGFFLKFIPLPLSLAWAAFREGNGASTFDEFRNAIGEYLGLPVLTKDVFIGCNILSEPFFFERSDWIPSYGYLRGPIVSGKGDFDLDTARMLWEEVSERLSRTDTLKNIGPATIAAQESARYGNPVMVAPRLGQGSFRALVTDAYEYRCAVTRERTLPVLQAAHIRPYANGGQHELSNGLLLRSDLHTLFDQHYLTVDPTKRTLVVSRRIREQFFNGRDYYALNDRPLAQPGDVTALPSKENLVYHYERFSQLERV